MAAGLQANAGSPEPKPVREVEVLGGAGSYLVLFADGTFSHGGLPAAVLETLAAAAEVERVSLYPSGDPDTPLLALVHTDGGVTVPDGPLDANQSAFKPMCWTGTWRRAGRPTCSTDLFDFGAGGSVVFSARKDGVTSVVTLAPHENQVGDFSSDPGGGVVRVGPVHLAPGYDVSLLASPSMGAGSWTRVPLDGIEADVVRGDGGFATFEIAVDPHTHRFFRASFEASFPE